jgi:hypothetical protein
MNEARVAAHFPKLMEKGFAVTSPFNEEYNCIAFAAGDVTRWWWPGGGTGHYWPTPGEAATLDAFQRAFRALGYEVCADGDFVPGVEKIAIFVSPNGTPTHAARQLPDGAWTSKLGMDVDIRHNAADGVEGDIYGRIACYMSRPISVDGVRGSRAN